MRRVSILMMVLFFLTGCAAEKKIYHLYDADLIIGEPGFVSTSRELKITTVDKYPIEYLLKKFDIDAGASQYRLFDCYLASGKHTIKVQARTGYNITLYSAFSFEVMIEAGHSYLISWENEKIRNAVVYITDLTTGEKVGTLQ